MEEENNSKDIFGELDWYKAKTVKEMRNDLMTMAKGNYFDDNQQYVFMADGSLTIQSGESLNDQAPEGPGPEEYELMDEEEIVSQYISRIKMFPPLVEVKDKKGFAEAYLPALDNMNNVAQYFTTGTGSRDNPMGSTIQYGRGMEIATEIGTGAITDYIQTGFKSNQEFYEWYLRDVANMQAVLQPGQIQEEDFSIVDGPFDDPMPVPNTRFPRREDVEKSQLKEKSQELRNKYPMTFNEYQRPQKFAINRDELPLKPDVNPMQKGQDFIDTMADMRRINPKVNRNKMKPERRRFF